MQTFFGDSDLLAILTELGESATYTPSGGAAKTIYIVRDRDVIVDLGTNTLGEGALVILARTSDLTGTVLGGTIVVDSTTYNIREPRPDGTGLTILGVEEA